MVKAVQIGSRLVLALIAVFVIAFIASPAVRHQVHWIRYGHDKVWYHNRDYLDPVQYTAHAAEQKFGQGQKLIPTGDKVIGLPVYDTKRSLTFQKQRGVVSTLLILKKPNGDFVVYSLSGGP